MTHEMKCIYRVAKVIIVTSLVKPLVVMLSYIAIASILSKYFDLNIIDILNMRDSFNINA